jgi:hypothetical protein
MLVLDDIATLWRLRDERHAVQVVKHNHVPKEDTKFLGATQTKYNKKNWSSVMLMNCERCTALTPEYVNTASGLELHPVQVARIRRPHRGNPVPLEPPRRLRRAAPGLPRSFTTPSEVRTSRSTATASTPPNGSGKGTRC